MSQRRFLAFDLGAESGRAVVGILDEGRLVLEEIHRFPNEPVEVCDTLHWDVLSLYNHLLKGLREYARRYGDTVDGIGLDTWAVDFGLLDGYGKPLQNPVHYRDRRTEGMVEQVAQRMPLRELYAQTGMNLLPIYTLCQLLALRLGQPELLDSARGYLMMPDLLGYFLTGRRACERTVAISTVLYDPRRAGWHEKLFRTFDLPLSIMPELVDPGTLLGELRDSVKQATGLRHAPVIAPCTHDTGSAVAAVPARGEDWAFLSSGTWSILGMLTPEVIATEEAYAAGVCNELTVDGLFVCRNIMGLWLLQQARVAWERAGQSYSYAYLVELARQAPAGGPVVYPDASLFMAPADMAAAIRQACDDTGQRQPEGVAEIARCILDSLALCYRQALEVISGLTGRRASCIHVVGGGSQNTLLCQLTADACGLPVIAGPSEATVIGNLLVQALAVGAVGSPAEVRQVVRDSHELAEYEPYDTSAWDERYKLYLRVVAQGR